MVIDWESILNKIGMGEDLIYITEQSKEIQENLTSLLNDDISLSIIVHAIINTLKYIKNGEGVDGFKFRSIPLISDFAGCFSKKADSIDNVFILSFEQLMIHYKTNSRERYYCKYLNPILYNYVEKIVGNELDNINNYLNKTMFLFTLNNLRKDTVRKAIGFDYREEALYDKELTVRGGFTSLEDLKNLTESLGCIVPCIGYKFSNCQSYGCTLSLKNFIVGKINSKEVQSLMYEESECSTNAALTCFHIKYFMEKYTDIPINYETIVKKYDLDLQGLIDCTEYSRECGYVCKTGSLNIANKFIKGKFDKYCLVRDNGNYLVYKLKLSRHNKLKYTSFAKAIMKKYNISELDVLDKLYLFEGNISSELLGEACLIETVVSERKIYIPALSKYYRGHSYHRSMRIYNLPISILRDR